MPKYRVTLDGRTFELTGDHPPTEDEARAATGLTATKAQSESAPAAPEPGYLSQVADRFTSGLKRAVHNPAVGAGLATAVAAPLTGGLSLIPAALSMAGAGAGGALLTGADLPTAAKEGALSAAGEGTGRAVAGGLRMMGRGLYRTALAPTEKLLTKYKNLVPEGLATRTPVDAGGLAKAAESKAGRMATKAAALAEADPNVAFSAHGITNEAETPLREIAAKQVKAGYPDPWESSHMRPGIGERLAQFQDANPPGSLTPQSLEEVKGTIDDMTGGAWKKLRMREPLTPAEHADVELTKAISRRQEQAVPGYRAMNRGIMDAEGLRRAIERRTAGSGGNQILDTLMMFMRGPQGVAGRAAMLPAVMSRAGIRANQLGNTSVAPSAFRTALLSMLGQGQDQP